MSLVEVKNVSFTYPNGFVAVDGVSFKLEKGENIAIVGQNGAGTVSYTHLDVYKRQDQERAESVGVYRKHNCRRWYAYRNLSV